MNVGAPSSHLRLSLTLCLTKGLILPAISRSHFLHTPYVRTIQQQKGVDRERVTMMTGSQPGQIHLRRKTQGRGGDGWKRSEQSRVTADRAKNKKKPRQNRSRRLPTIDRLDHRHDSTIESRSFVTFLSAFGLITASVSTTSFRRC